MPARTLRPLICALVLACGVAGGGARAATDCETPCTLDLAHPHALRNVGSALAAPERVKFVQVDVLAVENPDRIPLSFVVHYLPGHGDAVVLGSFSLFPPDQPGRFIVATGGRLRSGGAVKVSLEPLASVGEDAGLRVRLGGIAFVDARS